MSKIALSLYKDSDKLMESQLRSVLLFCQFGKKVASEDYMFQRLLFSLMVEVGKEMDIEDVRQVLSSDELYSDLRNKDLKKLFDQLEHNGLIKMQPSRKFLTISEGQEGEEFFRKLKNDTDELIEGIYQRFLKLHGNSTPTNSQLIKNKIREALSVYLKLSGLAIFELQKEDSNPKDALQELLGNNPDSISLHLVTAIGETIANSTDREEAILNQWAKAYVVTQILQLDPTLKHFKQDQLRNKSFVLDTDVVLHSLATNTKFSVEYREILDYLKRLGCKIYVPKDILKEAEGHAKEAIDIVTADGEEQVRQYKDFLLYRPKSNVFIEDFVQQVNNIPNRQQMPFSMYIGNIYNPRSTQVMKTRLANVIGEENVKREFKMLPLEEKLADELNAIILDKTSSSPKGLDRKDSFNEKISRFDTELYLSLVNYNQNGNPDDAGLLPNKFYLLTYSTRTIRAAKELKIYTEDIICKPQALTAVLSDLGEIADSEVSFINLFENPFLVYTAEQVWDRIQPIIDKGALIYFADIQQLKADVDTTFDDILMGEGKGFNYEKLKEIEKSGLRFPSELLRVEEENRKLRQENEDKDKEIEKRDAEIKKKDKIISRMKYEGRIKNGANVKKKKQKRSKK